VFVDTVAAPASDYILNVTTSISLGSEAGISTPVILFASFAEDPFDQFSGTPLGRWIDVLFSSTAGVNQVEIRIHFTADEALGLKQGSLRLHWWNGEQWKVCSNSGVDKANGFVWGRVNVTASQVSPI